MSLRLLYEGRETVIPDDTTAVIGSDPDATVRVAKPGISRRHVLVKHDGHAWVVQDASSRNGTYHAGTRIQTLDVSGTTKILLGHPSDGPELTLEPTSESASTTTKVVPRFSTAPAPAAVAQPGPTVRDQELQDTVKALRDMVKSVKGLTWSVWAMIAVTAVLAILTLFVGIISR